MTDTSSSSGTPADARAVRRTFLVLWLLGVVGAAAILPYLWSLLPALEAQVPPKGPRPPLPVLALLSVLQSSLMLAGALAAGLWLARRLGLGAPIVEARVAGLRAPAWAVAKLGRAAATGAAAGAVIVGLERWVFQPRLPPALAEAAAPPWTGLLASLYGATAEEYLSRLLLLSALAWLALRVRGRPVSRPLPSRPRGQVPAGVFWAANAGAALAFGALHLPTTALLVPLTPLVVARALVLNAVGALAFGYWYWVAGLEAAMLAHLCADLVLHVLVPLAAT
jgi:hypothetical protein